MFDNLTNKGSSVNPFLTMMYYKISFNTWLNAMRKHHAAQVDPDGLCPHDETQKESNKQVMIEVEEIVEYTSEEEDEEEFDEPQQKSLFNERSPTSSKRSKLGRMGTRNNSSVRKSVKGMSGSDMKTSMKKSNKPLSEEKLK